LALELSSAQSESTCHHTRLVASTDTNSLDFPRAGFSENDTHIVPVPRTTTGFRIEMFAVDNDATDEPRESATAMY
jgi:hypothetical protein